MSLDIESVSLDIESVSLDVPDGLVRLRTWQKKLVLGFGSEHSIGQVTQRQPRSVLADANALPERPRQPRRSTCSTAKTEANRMQWMSYCGTVRLPAAPLPVPRGASPGAILPPPTMRSATWFVSDASCSLRLSRSAQRGRSNETNVDVW